MLLDGQAARPGQTRGTLTSGRRGRLRGVGWAAAWPCQQARGEGDRLSGADANAFAPAPLCSDARFRLAASTLSGTIATNENESQYA